MSEMDNYMDLVINPALNNNPLNQLLNSSSNSQAEQIDAFEKVFDDISEQFNKDIESLSEIKPIENIENKSEKQETDFLSLMGNNFGPPLGLNIENFDYSLI